MRTFGGPIAAFGVLACLGAAVPALSQNATTPGEWMAKAPMPAIRNEVAAVAVHGKLHVLGGSIGGGQYDLTRNEEYDPSTDRWRARAALPRGANHMNAVAVNG